MENSDRKLQDLAELQERAKILKDAVEHRLGWTSKKPVYEVIMSHIKHAIAELLYFRKKVQFEKRWGNP